MASLVEVRVAGENVTCRAARNSVKISPSVIPYRPNSSRTCGSASAALEQFPLAAQRVLVEQNQPALRRRPGPEYSVACPGKLSRRQPYGFSDGLLGNSSSHSSTMVSHGRPRSTCSRTSETKILVPRNVSLP